MKLKLTLEHSKDLLRVGSGVQLECAGLKTLKKGYSEIFCWEEKKLQSDTIIIYCRALLSSSVISIINFFL